MSIKLEAFTDKDLRIARGVVLEAVRQQPGIDLGGLLASLEASIALPLGAVSATKKKIVRKPCPTGCGRILSPPFELQGLVLVRCGCGYSRII